MDHLNDPDVKRSREKHLATVAALARLKAGAEAKKQAVSDKTAGEEVPRPRPGEEGVQRARYQNPYSGLKSAKKREVAAGEGDLPDKRIKVEQDDREPLSLKDIKAINPKVDAGMSKGLNMKPYKGTMRYFNPPMALATGSRRVQKQDDKPAVKSQGEKRKATEVKEDKPVQAVKKRRLVPRSQLIEEEMESAPPTSASLPNDTRETQNNSSRATKAVKPTHRASKDDTSPRSKKRKAPEEDPQDEKAREEGENSELHANKKRVVGGSGGTSEKRMKQGEDARKPLGPKASKPLNTKPRKEEKAPFGNGGKATGRNGGLVKTVEVHVKPQQSSFFKDLKAIMQSTKSRSSNKGQKPEVKEEKAPSGKDEKVTRRNDKLVKPAERHVQVQPSMFVKDWQARMQIAKSPKLHATKQAQKTIPPSVSKPTEDAKAKKIAKPVEESTSSPGIAPITDAKTEDHTKRTEKPSFPSEVAAASDADSRGSVRQKKLVSASATPATKPLKTTSQGSKSISSSLHKKRKASNEGFEQDSKKLKVEACETASTDRVGSEQHNRKAGHSPTDTNPKPRGITNPRYACYANAAIQCLRSIQALVDSCSDGAGDIPSAATSLVGDHPELFEGTSRAAHRNRNSLKKAMNSEKGGVSISAYLKHMFEALEQTQPEGLCSSLLLREAFGFVYRDVHGNVFDGTSQQDAQELLTKILASLEEELAQTRADTAKLPSSILGVRSLTKFHCQKCGEKTTRAPETQLTMSLQFLPRDAADVDLHDLLRQEFYEWENLADYRCENCDQVGGVRKKVDLEDLGDNLIINVPRALGLDKKNSTKVRLPLPSAISLSVRQGRLVKRVYEIDAFIEHFGSSARSGHYTMCRKMGDKWWEVDDDKVTELDIGDVLNRKEGQTFLLHRVRSRETERQHG